MKTPILLRRHSGFAWQIPFSRKELAVLLDAMRAGCGLENLPLDVTLADDAFVSAVNLTYLGCFGPTNILSFPPAKRLPRLRPCAAPSIPAAFTDCGMLLLSLDAVNREAFLYGQKTAVYALRLFAHGLAHLAGLEHGDALDALQKKAFAAGGKALKNVV
ncbi:endoribonuclease YbeY [Deltaproteobacteria bacterium]|nr:endoribonuclease YbeY [Deltaproteobacteria bacterium]